MPEVFIILVIILIFYLYRQRYFDELLTKLGNHEFFALNNTRRITLYYAEWCGYCKQFMPTWDRLAADLASSNIIFRKIEGDKNPSPDVDGFPTIIMLTANGTKVKYQGDRSYENVKSWVLDPTL